MGIESNQPAKSYRDLTTWQSARVLCLTVYQLTADFPAQEQFGLISQMRRAAVSTPSNIAEGFGRQTAKEKQQFYHHALGSLFELETQADIAAELAFIPDSRLAELVQEIESCRRKLLALIKANQRNFPNRKSLIPNR
ncbi:four helix bundle protein [Candidatus Saccharibacteria bacterium]|nr:four helix bundle protein [Candidatus Saccharibacteria bacterium]